MKKVYSTILPFVICMCCLIGLTAITVNAQTTPINLPGHPEAPIAYWSFDDCTAKDNTGNGHDGMIMGKAVCVDGVKGKGLRLNSASPTAIGDYVKIAWSEEFRSDDFTISAWVNFDGGYNKGQMIFAIPSHVSWDNAISFEWHPDTNLLENYTYYRQWRSAPFDLRWNWRLVTTTKIGSSTQIYVDDQLIVSTNDVPAKIDYGYPRSVLIGADDDSGNDGKADIWWFKGMIDEVYFYNPSLKHQDVKDLYAAKMAEHDVSAIDVYPPAGAVDAYNNVLWAPNNKPVDVTLSGYVFDEISATRDKTGCGISEAYLLVNGATKITLKDSTTNLINDKCNYTVTTPLLAVKDAIYPIELYATDTNPSDVGGANSGLVHATRVIVPHDMGNSK